ncbi:MAG: FAD-binding oxidoreductase [Halobacteriales archaeon]
MTDAADNTFLADLGLASDQYSVDETVRTEHATDWGTDEADGVAPTAVVYPETTTDVAAVLEAANDRNIPVTPYAAGTSLEGNPIPTRGGISLDCTRMDAIEAIRPADLQIDVEPGLIGSEINAALEEYGLFFPPMPQSADISTIGGMIANDASGAKTVKYGEIHEWVRALEVVLADGSVVELGSKAKKSSSGYNLKDLIVGSEGTLGVVTRATLELTPKPAQIRGGRAVFESVTAATDAISAAITAGIDVATIELIDPLSARITNEEFDLDLPDAPMVFLEFHAAHSIETEVDRCRAIFDDHGLLRMDMASEPAEMERLWEARSDLANAVGRYREDLRMLTFGDVTVPMGEYSTIVGYIRSLAAEHDRLIPAFGHAGDGNVHYTVLVDPDDPDDVAFGKELMDQIIDRALELGGTATGEHGIGRGKREFMTAEHGVRGVALMRGIKQTFDPNDILNPGKLFPETKDGGRVEFEERSTR